MSADSPQQPLAFNPPSIDEIGALLQAYQFDAFIAKGGMGAVYKATQISLDRPVAVKILPVELSTSPGFKESFETEAKLMAKLNHPNLISIYDFGEIDNMLYIVMEYVPGDSLHAKAHGRKLKQQAAAKITLGILRGLEHAHEAGILHRDIKPANIFLSDAKRPKIGDFGLARPSSNKETGIIYGTPDYSAPEVLQAPDKVGAHTDVFAVGVILYELLTGQLPDALYRSPTVFCDCDPAFDKIIRRAIDPTPQKRYRSAEEMAEDIDKVMRGVATKNSKSSSPARKQLKAGTAQPMAKPVLATAAKKATPATLATATSAQGSKPATQLDTHDSKPTSAPAMAVGSSGSSATARNIVIILVLLGAIYFAHSMLVQKRERLANAEEENKKEMALQKLAKENAAKNNPLNRPSQKGGTAQRPSKPNKPTLTPQPLPKKLSTFETIESMRNILANGERPLSLMPEAAVTLSGKKRMVAFVDQPMTWHDADRWCSAHGGYLAVIQSRSDANKLQEIIPSDKTAWLGAATCGYKNWTWIDNTPWSDVVPIRKTSKLRYARIDDTLSATAEEAHSASPFFIEWQLDGSQPASLANRLKKARSSFSDATPQYPPGSISFGSRHYYFINQALTLDEALEMAELAGATLAVPSEESEAAYINNLVAEQLPAGQVCRIGGRRSGDHWQWTTNETWNFAYWASGYPTQGNSLAIAPVEGGAWKDISASDTTAFTLLEWSKDKPNASDSTATAGPNSTATGVDDLKGKAATLVTKEQTSRESQHAENVKRIVWDLDFYFKGLSKNDKARQKKNIEQLKSMVAGKTRIPQTIAGKGPTARAQHITKYAFDKQGRIDSDIDKRIEKLRLAYQAQLKKLAAELTSKSQVSAAKSATTELQKSGNNVAEFIRYFE